MKDEDRPTIVLGNFTNLFLFILLNNKLIYLDFK